MHFCTVVIGSILPSAPACLIHVVETLVVWELLGRFCNFCTFGGMLLEPREQSAAAISARESNQLLAAHENRALIPLDQLILTNSQQSD